MKGDVTMAAKKDVVEKTAPVKAEEVKAEVKKEAVKKETVKKEAVKKETAKKAPAEKKACAKKAEVKAAIHVQYAGRSLAEADLVKMAQDVWQYDMGMKAEDFKTVELYVKPEENVTYFVVNGEFTGSFLI